MTQTLGTGAGASGFIPTNVESPVSLRNRSSVICFAEIFNPSINPTLTNISPATVLASTLTSYFPNFSFTDIPHTLSFFSQNSKALFGIKNLGKIRAETGSGRRPVCCGTPTLDPPGCFQPVRVWRVRGRHSGGQDSSRQREARRSQRMSGKDGREFRDGRFGSCLSMSGSLAGVHIESWRVILRVFRCAP